MPRGYHHRSRYSPPGPLRSCSAPFQLHLTYYMERASSRASTIASPPCSGDPFGDPFGATEVPRVLVALQRPCNCVHHCLLAFIVVASPTLRHHVGPLDVSCSYRRATGIQNVAVNIVLLLEKEVYLPYGMSTKNIISPVLQLLTSY